MSDADGNLCVIGSEPHRSAIGLLVCEGHRERLHDALRAIVDTVARIHITPARTGGQTGGTRSGSLASQRSILDLEALALAGPQAPGEVTNGIGWDDKHPLATIGSWARMIREERNLQPLTGPAVLTTEVSTVVFWLDWACTQTWITEMYDEIQASAGRVNAADPDRVRPGDEGRCPAVGFGPANVCGGQLRRERGSVPWVRLEDRCERSPVDVHAGVVKCQKCGSVWASETDEARLRIMRSSAARNVLRPVGDGRWETIDEVHERTGKAKGAIRRQLNRSGARSVNGFYDTSATESVSA